MIEIKPEEARLIFEKWDASKAPVLCSAALYGWGFVLRGKLSVSDDDVVITAEDGATLKFRLGLKDWVWGYSEPSEFADLEGVPEDAKAMSSLIAALPLRLTLSEFSGPLFTPRREKLFLMELRERRD